MLRNNTTQWEEQINFCSPYLIVIWIQISQGQIYTSVDALQMFAKKIISIPQLDTDINRLYRPKQQSG